MNDNNLGTQPLDTLMESFGLSSQDLVAASTEQLTYKMVQRGRKGRRLTPNVQMKILRALQSVKPDESTTLTDLFNYGSSARS